MNLSEVKDAIRQAENTLANADTISDDMAYLLLGRCRNCSPCWLKQLKRELRLFSVATGKWADTPDMLKPRKL